MRRHGSRIRPHRPELQQNKWLFMPTHPRLTKNRRPRIEKTEHSQQQQNRQAKNQPQKRKENIKKTNHIKSKGLRVAGKKLKNRPL